jgi:hypothetical protein
MKNYVYNPEVQISSSEAEKIYCQDFLKECFVPRRLAMMLIDLQDEIHFGRTNNMYFYVLDGIISCYR